MYSSLLPLTELFYVVSSSAIVKFSSILQANRSLQKLLFVKMTIQNNVRGRIVSHLLNLNLKHLNAITACKNAF